MEASIDVAVAIPRTVAVGCDAYADARPERGFALGRSLSPDSVGWAECRRRRRVRARPLSLPRTVWGGLSVGAEGGFALGAEGGFALGRSLSPDSVGWAECRRRRRVRARPLSLRAGLSVGAAERGRGPE